MKWRNLNIEEAVWQELEKYRSALDFSVKHRPLSYPEPMRGKRVSLGEAIAYLIAHRRKHQARSRKSLLNSSCSLAHESIDSPVGSTLDE